MALFRQFHAETDSVDKNDWSDITSLFEDANIYQTWSYGAVRWGSDNLSHFLLKKDGQVVACAQVAIFRTPFISAGVAYLRWGPLCRSRDAGNYIDIVRNMIAALKDEYVIRRRLLLRVIPNPLYEDNRGPDYQSAYEVNGFSRTNIGNKYRTLLIDLYPTLEELRKRLAQKWRCDLNRAERNGLTVIMGTTADLFDKFKVIYDEMLLRKCFKTSVDINEFRQMQQNLPESSKMQILLCEYEGEPVAGAIFSAMGDTGIYILGATSTNGMKTKGSNLLQWKAIEWLKANGYRYYDLAGIDPENNPGGYHFKAGLGGQEICLIGHMEACDCLTSQVVVDLSRNFLPLYIKMKKASDSMFQRRIFAD